MTILFWVVALDNHKYNQGYLAGQNNTLNKYDCYNKSNFVQSNYSHLIAGNITWTEPRIVGYICSGNYTTKINSTFIGCVKK